MPNTVYHANYKSVSPRRGSFAQTFTFGAADDSAAEAIAALLDAATDAQRVSLTKRVYADSVNESHPAGSVRSARVVLRDDTNAVMTQHILNINPLCDDGESSLAALFLGNAYAATIGGITILGNSPKLPTTGNDVSVVTVTLQDKV